MERTARIAAESALQDSEARLALAMEAHALGIFEWNVATGAVVWSSGAELRLGFKPNSVTDFTSWSEQVVPEDLVLILEAIKHAAEAKLPSFPFRYRVLQANSAVRVIEGTARCIFGEGGELIRTIGVNIDVTEREEREAALQRREAQLRSILETVPDAMVVIDERGLIQSFSAAAERMFGYQADELIGKNVSLLTPENIRQGHDGYLQRYLVTGERRVIGSTRLLTGQRKDGTELPIELSVGEALVGVQRLFTGFVRDISERVAAEGQAHSLRGELARTGRVTAMGEMAASLAHELNQPLAATANFLGAATIVAESQGDAEKLAELLKLASGQVLRAGDIIRNLRQFIAKREVETRVEPIEKTVRDAVALVFVGSTRFEIALRYNFGPTCEFMLADRIQIQQVLVNLLRNAIEALQSQPAGQREVEISSRRINASMIEISVADSGPGIRSEILAKMFTPFSSSKGADGMGLGLSICRSIVEAHGGKISADNQPGGGAIFRFTLPEGGETGMS
jgi:two-component system sensor kinase FixL